MSVRAVFAVVTLLAALVPASADACGMPYRGGGNDLLVKLQSIQPVAETNQSLMEPKAKDPFELTYSPERAALAQSVVDRLAKVAPVVPPRPQS